MRPGGVTAGVAALDEVEQVEHQPDAGMGKPETGERLDPGHLFEVGVGVTTATAGRASRVHEAPAFVRPQGLGVGAGQLGGDGDHVARVGRVPAGGSSR